MRARRQPSVWLKARKVTAKQGVLTLDMGPNYDAAAGPVGHLAEAQVKQVKAIRTALRQGANAAMPKRLKRFAPNSTNTVMNTSNIDLI